VQSLAGDGICAYVRTIGEVAIVMPAGQFVNKSSRCPAEIRERSKVFLPTGNCRSGTINRHVPANVYPDRFSFRNENSDLQPRQLLIRINISVI